MEKQKMHIGNVLQNSKYAKQKEAASENDAVVTVSMNRDKGRDESAVSAGSLNTILESGAHGEQLAKFHKTQGHGHAAEQANHLIDALHGQDAVILGDDNAKNGPDRSVNGMQIQTKYCQNALSSVNAAFRNGQYRYLDSKGNPMQLEVPSDQYEEAVEIMRKRIAEGKVPGTTNPDDAEKLVRKGHVDYKTACNIAKAGTIDSLMFDAAHGTVIAASAFGISSVISFAQAVWSGKDREAAVDQALYTGLQAGGTAFVTSVMTAQLMRTGVGNMLMEPSIQLVKAMPSSVRHALVNVMRQGAPIYGNAATKNLAKLVRSNVIAAAAVMVVLSANDVSNFFSRRISAEQLFRNVMTIAAGLGGAGGGATLATAAASAAFGPGAIVAVMATLLGGTAGGALSGKAAKKLLDQFTQDDAVELVQILNTRFQLLASEYLLNKEEVELAVDTLQLALRNREILLNMYASTNRNEFADTLLLGMIERIICWRIHIVVPTDRQFMDALGRILNGEVAAPAIEADEELSAAHGKKREITDLSVAHRKARYMAQQLHAVFTQEEQVLQRMQVDEQAFQAKWQDQRQDIAVYRKELQELLGGR